MTAGPAAITAAAFADPSLPRSNGELVFDAPWQGRALAIAIALSERSPGGWDDFRRHLIAAVDHEPDRPYWESFVAALEGFTTDLGVAVPMGSTGSTASTSSTGSMDSTAR